MTSADHAHHDHDRTFQPDEEESLRYYALAEAAVRELLVEKGIIEPDEVRRALEWFDTTGPETGARVVARAWTDPAFHDALIANADEAVKAFDIDTGHTKLYAVENQPGLHNVIVCTLCSCYPRALLGIPPDWYKSRAYRARIVREPREVLRELGLSIGDDTEVRVHDSTADLRYVVVPERPAGTEGWSEDALAEIITRDCLIGTAIPRAS